MKVTTTESPWKGRRTPRSVFLKDAVAGVVIRGGGFFVVAAVLGICVFLVAVVIPLFGAAEVGEPARFRLPADPGEIIASELNEYRSLGIAVLRSGEYVVFAAADGAAIRRGRLLPEGAAPIRSAARALSSGDMVLGLEDGSVALGRVGFDSRFIERQEVAPELWSRLSALSPGTSLATDEGVAEMTPLRQLRVSVAAVAVEAPVPVAGEGSGSPVVLVASRPGESGGTIATLLENGKLILSSATRKENLLDGTVSVRLRKYELPFEARPSPPSHLLLNGGGDQLFVAWSDGALHRLDLRDLKAPVIAERLDLCPDPGVTLTALRPILGEESLIAGDSAGGCAIWLRLPSNDGAAHPDGFHMVAVRRLEPQAAAIRAVGVSPRDRTFATGADDGSVWLRHMTSARVLARLDAGGGGSAPQAVARLQITPKADGVFAQTASGDAISWPYDNPHPETTPGTIFGRVWYEGAAAPTHTWQSTGGTDDYEPKLGLVPLIFGTLKATSYALIFAVPIAVLAAIYTSELLSRRARAMVKPAIEMMASLPSVVLGFLAALVIAPLAESWVLSLLLLCIVVPCTMILGSYLWLFLPHGWAFRLEGLPKLFVATVTFGLGIWLAFPLGLWLEDAFFLGDFRVWLAPPRRGSPAPAWALMLLPVAVAAVWYARNRWILPRFGGRWMPPGAAGELAKGVATFAAGLGLSAVAGGLLAACGIDPRDSIVGTYVQRNTLIVGFVMGFAVIPIIYTISEDALAAVPEHLRGAALGCGATPWQTAVGVILPTAMSGIFSAAMVGLGRAVGETMIVVMAAGNTPIMDVSPFNGLRALSATIAVELPEAVKDGTLYRMLFLAALCLFAMTFVVNTAAELVRMRFRKRAFEL